MPLDLAEQLAAPAESRLSRVAASVGGSMILKIAAEIRERQDAGHDVCNLSVGDYSPVEFPVPTPLLTEIKRALDEGHVNYPPSIGTPELRHAVTRYIARELGLAYPFAGVFITAGSRAIVDSFFRATLNKGDVALSPVPAWNVHYYAGLAEAELVTVETRAEDGFLPRREQLEPELRRARVLCLCSPGNPTGTTFEEEHLAAICDMVLEENARRREAGERDLLVLYDQVYWPITHKGRKHLTPVGLRPEMARYTVFVDGISKAFAATGVRVGWGFGPPDIIAGMAKFTGHGGAWAAKFAQLGTARFLDDAEAVKAAFKTLQQSLEARLDLLTKGLAGLRDKGLPVDFIQPTGALYVTFKMAIADRTGPDGQSFGDNESIRAWLLEHAGMGIVPFEAFGVPAERAHTWFRLSVGAASKAQIEALIPRLEAALATLS